MSKELATVEVELQWWSSSKNEISYLAGMCRKGYGEGTTLQSVVENNISNGTLCIAITNGIVRFVHNLKNGDCYVSPNNFGIAWAKAHG